MSSFKQRIRRGLQKRTLAVMAMCRPISDPLLAWKLSRQGYLSSVGWNRSIYEMMPVDAAGQPIPWFTYPILDFLHKRLDGRFSPLSVFEYGSGQSTRWWSSRVARVVSCEHDEGWYALMRPTLGANVEYLFKRLDEGYSEAILSQEEPFDVVVVDGRLRVRCARNAVSKITEKGILIWDDSERAYYEPGKEFLTQQGFRELEFPGLRPSSFRGGSTSIFYRDGNLLGL